MNWNDVNVLRKLSDGWYSVPSDSEYGEMISKNLDIKLNDSVEKAKKRHEDVLEKEREIDNFVKSERLRDKPDTCVHKNHSYKGYELCEVCGLTKTDNFIKLVNMLRGNDVMNRMCNKARGIFGRIVSDLSYEYDIETDELLKVFRTYVLTGDDRGNRNFRISARPEGLCAALLWRYLQIKTDRMTISCIFKRLDDYKDFKVNKRGRPNKK